MQDFKKLVVWQKAHQFTVEVYRQTAGFPKAEVFGLTGQVRRAASSIGANIAEGTGLGSDPHFRSHLVIAMGSANECENHLILARDLGYMAETDCQKLTDELIEVKKMLAGLIAKTRS